MLNTTWNRGTIVDKLSRYTIRPNGSKIYSNLLRTRKCFTTSHMHIYSIPPMSRMNFAQKRVPKLFCSDFIPVFSFSVVTTFFGNDNQLPNFLNSNTVIKLKKDRCKQAWIRSVYTWVANSPCTAVRWHGPGTENVLVDFGSECNDWGAIVSNSFLQNPWQLS